MSDEARRWLNKRVRVGAACAPSVTLAEGVVIGYLGGPSILVRDEQGRDSAWMTTLPIDVLGEVPVEELPEVEATPVEIANEVHALVEAAEPEGFCTCAPGLPMRDCGMAGHREVARLLRQPAPPPVDTVPRSRELRSQLYEWLGSHTAQITGAQHDHLTLRRLSDLLAQRIEQIPMPIEDKLAEILRGAGIEHPLGLRGVRDLVNQRDGHRERAEEAEELASRAHEAMMVKYAEAGQLRDRAEEAERRLEGIREVLTAWLISSADDDRETLNKIHALLSGGGL